MRWKLKGAKTREYLLIMSNQSLPRVSTSNRTDKLEPDWPTFSTRTSSKSRMHANFSISARKFRVLVEAFMINAPTYMQRIDSVKLQSFQLDTCTSNITIVDRGLQGPDDGPHHNYILWLCIHMAQLQLMSSGMEIEPLNKKRRAGRPRTRPLTPSHGHVGRPRNPDVLLKPRSLQRRYQRNFKRKYGKCLCRSLVLIIMLLLWYWHSFL